ncbi:hypothetical protein [Sulfitobacter sp. MF3-043]|uniref:hypothetical protein n=1 Tax=Sulfitobacter sediminivivens TaxID=3252902 RepID=UPI0036DC3184
MSASAAIMLSLPIMILAFALWVWHLRRRAAMKVPPQEHAAHSPETGYDRAAIARSILEGHASGGNR